MTASWLHVIYQDLNHNMIGIKSNAVTNIHVCIYIQVVSKQHTISQNNRAENACSYNSLTAILTHM